MEAGKTKGICPPSCLFGGLKYGGPLIFSNWLTHHVVQVHYEELNEFNECVAAGTAAALVPIKSITLKSKNLHVDFNINDDEPG